MYVMCLDRYRAINDSLFEFVAEKPGCVSCGTESMDYLAQLLIVEGVFPLVEFHLEWLPNWMPSKIVFLQQKDR